MLDPLLYIIFFVGLLCSLFQPSPCFATDLRVQVFYQGNPAKAVTVCAGSVQQRGLYKITTTDENGLAVFKKLPDGKVTITANIDRHGKDKFIISAGYQQNVMIALPEVEEGPVCPPIDKELKQ